MATLDSTNSHTTIAEADAYHETVTITDANTWNDFDDDTKTRSLIMATRSLDDLFVCRGTLADDAQPLSWPRVLKDGEDAVTPVQIKNAVAEWARIIGAEIVAQDAGLDKLGETFKSLKFGSVALEFAKADERTDVPEHIERMVDRFCTLESKLKNRAGLVQGRVSRY